MRLFSGCLCPVAEGLYCSSAHTGPLRHDIGAALFSSRRQAFTSRMFRIIISAIAINVLLLVERHCGTVC